jgi:predicted tellurium resistance membrane protein TerC
MAGSIESAGGGQGAGGQGAGSAGDDPNAPPTRSNNPTNNAVQRTRSWTGLLVVAISDVVIAVAAIWGIVKTSSTSASSSSTVAILTAAFTAIGTMTTAYFGIKSVTNTAQSYAPSAGQGGGGQGGGQ